MEPHARSRQRTRPPASDPTLVACFVDLDGTLWRGSLAERQTPVPISRRLRALRFLAASGVQIFAVTRNDTADVDAAFDHLSIDRGLFTWVLANWESKYRNIGMLLELTEIEPARTAYFDDNEFERLEAQSQWPKLRVYAAEELDNQRRIAQWIAARPLESPHERAQRMNRYRTAIAARITASSGGDDPVFLASLQRRAQIGPLTWEILDRAAHLIVDTHRLNARPSAFRSQSDALAYIQQLRATEGSFLYGMSASEQGLSLGLSGVLLGTRTHDSAHVTHMTFSCGVIGRGFEASTVAAVTAKVRDEGCREFRIDVTPTASNQRLREQLAALGFRRDGPCDHALSYALVLDKLQSRDFSNVASWITVVWSSPRADYASIPTVRRFFEDHVRALIPVGGHVLNLGASHGETLGLRDEAARRAFEADLRSRQVTYTKIDLDVLDDPATVVANAEDLRGIVTDESQDVVLALELLEHTEHPDRVLREMVRVCRPDGHLVITVPGKSYPKHEFPVDLWRIGDTTLRQLFEDGHGFRVLRCETEGSASALFRTLLLVRKERADAELSSWPQESLDLHQGLRILP